MNVPSAAASFKRALRHTQPSDWLVLLLIALFVGFAWQHEFKTEQAVARARLNAHADQIESAVKDSVARIRELLSANAAFQYASDNVTASKLEEFNRELMPAVPAVFQFQWLAWVPGPDRAAYEAVRRKAGLSDYFIFEPVGEADRRPAGQRAAHAVIHYSLRKGDHLSSIGLDVLFTKEREARYWQSLRQNSTQVSPVIPIYVNRTTLTGPVSTMLPGIIITTPIYRTHAATNDAARREREIRGFITAVIDVEQMFRLSIDPLLSGSFEILVAQTEQNDQWQLISRRSLHAEPNTTLSQEIVRASADDIVREPMIVGKPLTLLLRPSPVNFLTDHVKSSLYLGLGVGLLLLSLALLISFRNQAERRQQACEQARQLDETARQNALLETRVADRTRALMESNNKLQAALESLALTQDELVRSEKLASLGNLVAGIAHELNTPIGNSVMVASTLTADSQKFGEEIAGGSLRKSSLTDFLERIRHASEMLERNLERASTLIGNFKQLAVDQTSERRRSFNLEQMVRDTLSTLHPVLRKTRLSIEIDIPSDIVMNSYPGPLGQVIINLLENARLHAFAEDEAGTVRVSAVLAANQSIQINVSDNGRGIAADILPRIFDPFFTTRLGQGGSGLGLHLAYGIVTRNLGGRLRVSSEPGHGTLFMLELPLQSPEPVAGEPPAAVDVAANPFTAEEDHLVANLRDRHLLDLRAVIEPRAAELAATLGGAADITHIGQAFERFDASFAAGDSMENQIECDFAFHMAIMRATRDPVLQKMGDSMLQLLYGHLRRRLNTMLPENINREALRVQHRAIWEAIRDHDGPRAAAAAAAHMRYVIDNSGLLPENPAA